MRSFSFVQQCKTYYLTQKYELRVFQLYALVVCFFVPFFGYALKYADPSAVEYYSHRYLISAYWLLIAVLSFKIEFLKKYMTFFATIGTYLFMFWIVWIVKINHFSPEYTVGFFLSFCASGIVFRHLMELGLFISIILLTTIFVIFTTPNLEVQMGILLLSMVAIGLVYFIVMASKSYINGQLELLNQTLEEKVAERTQIAEQRTKELAVKNQELEQFAYIASHDLKAPLRTISGFVSLLDRKTKKLGHQDLQEYSKFILDGTNRMNQTVDNLLDYSRMGRTNMQVKPVDIHRLITVVLHGLNSQVNLPNVQINLPNRFPPQVICEAQQIEQLFQNLIENALKFNQSDFKIVTIAYEEYPDSWAFSVQDNGIGIAEEYQQQIFEMFNRLHTYDEFSGTGIGLATCKRIVENHAGQISIESVLGKGTCFKFTIAKKGSWKEEVSVEEGVLVC